MGKTGGRMKTKYLVPLAVAVPIAIFGATVLIGEFDPGSPGVVVVPANHVVQILHPNEALVGPSDPARDYPPVGAF
ncbi:hypothetical protein [Kutzneria sp. CA-103260]|uniref:hypothetical protein n=1 Tax=Kutzneria sp. CA-103260 TaxID=2802641 RepID=UPI001BA56603|nr:hypothetical protein [Kutzneria sp. CA-103260]QUQ68994.1 hypothetical protein JJ691_67480 [Kutzneria sp. CA-103260]